MNDPSTPSSSSSTLPPPPSSAAGGDLNITMAEFYFASALLYISKRIIFDVTKLEDQRRGQHHTLPKGAASRFDHLLGSVTDKTNDNVSLAVATLIVDHCLTFAVHAFSSPAWAYLEETDEADFRPAILVLDLPKSLRRAGVDGIAACRGAASLTVRRLRSTPIGDLCPGVEALFATPSFERKFRAATSSILKELFLSLSDPSDIDDEEEEDALEPEVGLEAEQESVRSVMSSVEPGDVFTPVGSEVGSISESSKEEEDEMYNDMPGLTSGLGDSRNGSEEYSDEGGSEEEEDSDVELGADASSFHHPQPSSPPPPAPTFLAILLASIYPPPLDSPLYRRWYSETLLTQPAHDTYLAHYLFQHIFAPPTFSWYLGLPTWSEINFSLVWPLVWWIIFYLRIGDHLLWIVEKGPCLSCWCEKPIELPFDTFIANLSFVPHSLLTSIFFLTTLLAYIVPAHLLYLVAPKWFLPLPSLLFALALPRNMPSSSPVVVQLWIVTKLVPWFGIGRIVWGTYLVWVGSKTLVESTPIECPVCSEIVVKKEMEKILKRKEKELKEEEERNKKQRMRQRVKDKKARQAHQAKMEREKETSNKRDYPDFTKGFAKSGYQPVWFASDQRTAHP